MAKAFPDDLKSGLNAARLVKEVRQLARLSPLSATQATVFDRLVVSVRQALTEQGDDPLFEGLAFLDNQGEEVAFDYLLEAADKASSTLTVRLSSKENQPAKGVFVLGLIPLNLTFMLGSIPFETLKAFILEHFDPAELFATMVQAGVCHASTVFGFLPQFLERSDWPASWSSQLERLREVLDRETSDRREGEYLSDFTVFSQKEPVDHLHTVGLVLPFIYMQSADDPEPFLPDILSASSLGLPLTEACAEAWSYVASDLEGQLIRTSGIRNVQVLNPGYQMPALENQQDLLNELNLRERILLLKQEAPADTAFQAFGEAYEMENGIEWRIVLRKGNLRAQSVWQMVSSWEETEEAILDIFHEQGIAQDQVHLNEELHTDSEITVCPECDAPLFIDPLAGELACGHPLPESRHFH